MKTLPMIPHPQVQTHCQSLYLVLLAEAGS